MSGPPPAVAPALLDAVRAALGAARGPVRVADLRRACRAQRGPLYAALGALAATGEVVRLQAPPPGMGSRRRGRPPATWRLAGRAGGAP